MKPFKFSLLAGICCLLFFNAAGGVVGKYIAFSNGGLFAVLVGVLFATFGARAIVWMLLGKRHQLSYIYPFMSINFVLSTVIGLWLFHEPITVGKVVGSGLIMIGVMILSTSKSVVAK
ncbi:MAG: hypothetical protein PF692_12085 [Kiritimatiellae bacterium]|jgi:uncharacterized membrane protein|nr:hypothetical protein [Kiritimatiellia bacterium]